MINSVKFLDFIKKKGISNFVGVPDSLMKEFCNSLLNKKNITHEISVNEGSAVANAIGCYLFKRKLSIVYFQNSGIGNALNPLLSIADESVYGIPMILFIGMRGEVTDGKYTDEPQHKKHGKITLDLLKISNIPYKIISKDTKNIKKIFLNLKKIAENKKKPVALVFQKGCFVKNSFSIKKNNNEINKKDILNIILENLNERYHIVSTTGFTSRELYSYRKLKKLPNTKDFLCVGGMGHASQISYSLAKFSKKKIICLDGDGSFLMHMGSIINNSKIKNLKHIVFNNFCHDSVGGQPTKINNINLEKFAISIGYKNVKIIKKNSQLKKDIFKKFFNTNNAGIMFVNCKVSENKNLLRPKKLKNLMDGFIKDIS